MYQPQIHIIEIPHPECPSCGSYDTYRTEANEEYNTYDCFACVFTWDVPVDQDNPIE